MKNDKTLKTKILEVRAINLNRINEPNPEKYEYTFEVEEFENGLIRVIGETTNDWFFEDADSIEACGNDIVLSIEEIGESNLKASSLLSSIQGSIKEFGINSVPVKHLELWR